MTSHAVAVARGWGKPYVRDCSTLPSDANSKLMRVRTTSGRGTGEGCHKRRPVKSVDTHRQMKVFTNADTPEDIRDARARDAQAHDVQRVGLTRTESCARPSTATLMAPPP
ncbi:hypothetical protein PR003_g16518 [Phytophthora rubi]|uniref:Uncharacterized protein n=2 Tax=Phytophthora rubi TaxID=129364 RepID=A0A6A3LK36_9STRA|nr:hypothetical protein PR001_g14714 [Phytophthora rubi]KAE9325278.1 hypothetical protein PR003_g16518 [Phytophthora rubi]